MIKRSVAGKAVRSSLRDSVIQLVTLVLVSICLAALLGARQLQPGISSVQVLRTVCDVQGAAIVRGEALADSGMAPRRSPSFEGITNEETGNEC